jgi:serine/threonine protein phosphatase PrpC
MKFEITKATDKGQRPYQEDRLVVHQSEEGHLLAAFDGHGGGACAEYCVRNLVPIFQSAMAEYNFFEGVIRDVFELLNHGTKDMGPGCAASIAFIPKEGRSVFVGVLGDAPVLVKKADGGLWLAPEHNVRTNKAEVAAAEERGGFVQGGYLFATYSGDGLQMSRALGDRHLDRVLNRKPEIFRLPLGAGSFVLVGTDGLFDPTHVTQPGETIAAAIEAGQDANQLVQNALAVPTYDNVTAILVRLSENK